MLWLFSAYVVLRTRVTCELLSDTCVNRRSRSMAGNFKLITVLRVVRVKRCYLVCQLFIFHNCFGLTYMMLTRDDSSARDVAIEHTQVDLHEFR